MLTQPPEGRSGHRPVAGTAVCILTLGIFTLFAPVALAEPARVLEAHVWRNSADGEASPLVAGKADDFWTSAGVHYRFDGTRIGELSFASERGGAPGQLVGLRVGPSGRVAVLGDWPGAGWAVSAHDENGRQLWLRSLGRPGPKRAAKHPVRQLDQDEPAFEVAAAELLGVDEEGGVEVAGWLQGCVDLAPAPASQVECASVDQAGKNLAGDAYPQLFFSSRFDGSGGWQGARTYPRLPARAVAWSAAGNVLAVTASGWWLKRLAFQAPDGTEASIRFGPDDPPFRSLVILFDGTGHVASVFHLLAHAGQVVTSMAFDRAGTLWLAVASSPGLEVRGRGSQRVGASAASCLSVLSAVPKKDVLPTFHGTSCVPGGNARLAVMLSAAPDGRIVIGGAPSGLADGETLNPPKDLDVGIPPPPRDTCGNVAPDYRATRVAVSYPGRPDWSVPVLSAFAVGLANGWTCLDTKQQLACVRPVPRQPSPASDPDK
jgi:hypothetical protein